MSKRTASRRGDVLILVAAGISLLAIIAFMSMYAVNSLRLSAQQQAFREEAAFYAGEVAAISSYLRAAEASPAPTINQGNAPFPINNKIDSSINP
ncbi:MAG: hypothetical protein HY537_03980 [Deltaproteobacteria bacterium]|nr:hypothetical protein [Deltaproteobacteria bacterium]